MDRQNRVDQSGQYRFIHTCLLKGGETMTGRYKNTRASSALLSSTDPEIIAKKKKLLKEAEALDELIIRKMFGWGEGLEYSGAKEPKPKYVELHRQCQRIIDSLSS